MFGEQEGVHGVIYHFGHVVCAEEWSKIPQQRLSGRAVEDYCPWCSVLYFFTEVTVGCRYFFSRIFWYLIFSKSNIIF